MEALTIIGAIAAIAIVCGISFAVHSYSSGTYDYLPFNRVTIGISFVCGLLIAVGVYLWSGAGFTANTLVVLGCGILVYVGLLVFVTLRSNILIAIWTVTILSALSAVVILVLLGRRVFRRLLRGLLRKRPRDRRRDPNAQTQCGATPPHRADAEAQEEEGHVEPLAFDDDHRTLNDDNAWVRNHDDRDGPERLYAGADPNAEDP